MSVTVDTAKYTQFYTLQRLCTFTKGLNQPKLSSHFLWWRGKGRRLRRDFSEVAFPWYTPEDTVPPITLHLQISGSRSTSSYSVKTEPILTLGCTNSIFTWRNVGPFVPGWPSTSEYPSGDPGTTLNSNSLKQLPNPPRWFINLVVILTFQNQIFCVAFFLNY